MRMKTNHHSPIVEESSSDSGSELGYSQLQNPDLMSSNGIRARRVNQEGSPRMGLSTAFCRTLLGLSLFLGACKPIAKYGSGSDTSPGSCRQIVFSYGTFSRNGIETNIVSTCPDGSEKRRLTVDGLGNYNPTWSPDGSQIAFISARDGVPELHLMDKNGESVRPPASGIEVRDLIWLPEGQRIAIQVPEDEGQWIWKSVEVTTGEIAELTDWNDDSSFQPWAFSHDGSRLAYSSGSGDGNAPSRQIRIRDLGGTIDFQLTTGEADKLLAAWSPDDAQIAFLSVAEGPVGEYGLYVIDIDGSNLHQIDVPKLADPRCSFAWSPHGRSLAIYDGTALYTLDLEGGTTYTLFTVDEPNYMSGVTWQP